jgi:hypothetical protein
MAKQRDEQLGLVPRPQRHPRHGVEWLRVHHT